MRIYVQCKKFKIGINVLKFEDHQRMSSLHVGIHWELIREVPLPHSSPSSLIYRQIRCGLYIRRMVRRNSDSSAAGCKAGPSSNLSSAPQRRPSSERNQWGDQEWCSTSNIYKIYVCSINVKIKKEWQHATKLKKKRNGANMQRRNSMLFLVYLEQ